LFENYFGSPIQATTQARAFQFVIPVSLHDAFSLAGDLPNANDVVFDMPATSPIALPVSDTLITVDVRPEAWRFGYWRTQVEQVYVP
jgi:hypothetical protein